MERNIDYNFQGLYSFNPKLNRHWHQKFTSNNSVVSNESAPFGRLVGITNTINVSENIYALYTHTHTKYKFVDSYEHFAC